MSSLSRREPGSTADQQPGLPTRIVVATWLGSYFCAIILSLLIVGLSGYADSKTVDQPFWLIGLTTIALWLPMLVALGLIGNRYGTGDPRIDFGFNFRTIDITGLLIGVLAQVVIVPLITWPFQQIWPSTFSTENVEERARDLYDTANGAWIIGLVLLVVVGAPLVEELMYRGFIQRYMKLQLGNWPSLFITSAWFTAIHLTPVEFPGLFCFALILGYCTLKTGRIGMSVIAHIGFNATGLILVAAR